MEDSQKNVLPPVLMVSVNHAGKKVLYNLNAYLDLKEHMTNQYESREF
jgi:hypothetical protein